MKLLKKNNFWIYLILNVITFGIFNIFIAAKLKLKDEDAWYSKWQYWFFGTCCLLFPVIIMFIVYVIEMNCKVCSKLKVSGSNIYSIPYSWILFIIIPIVGWVLLITMYLYVIIMPSIKVLQGVKINEN